MPRTQKRPAAPATPTRAKPIVMEKEVEDRLVRTVKATWQRIGIDVTQACQEAGERLTNYAAVECVIDANHMATHGGEHGKEMDKLVTDLCESHSYDQVMRFLMRRCPLA